MGKAGRVLKIFQLFPTIWFCIMKCFLESFFRLINIFGISRFRFFDDNTSLNFFIIVVKRERRNQIPHYFYPIFRYKGKYISSSHHFIIKFPYWKQNLDSKFPLFLFIERFSRDLIAYAGSTTFPSDRYTICYYLNLLPILKPLWVLNYYSQLKVERKYSW